MFVILVTKFIDLAVCRTSRTFRVYDTEDLSLECVSYNELCEAIESLGVDCFYNVDMYSSGMYCIGRCWGLQSSHVAVDALGWRWRDGQLSYNNCLVVFKKAAQKNILLYRRGVDVQRLGVVIGDCPKDFDLRLECIELSKDIPWLFLLHYTYGIMSFIVAVDKDGAAHGLFVSNPVIHIEPYFASDKLITDVAKLELLSGTGWWSGLLRR